MDISHTEKIESSTLTCLLDDACFTKKHQKIWALSSMGILLDGFDLFVLSVALPLIIYYFGATPIQAGLIGAAATIGAIAGSVIGGHLTDKYGRKKIFLLDLGLFIIAAILCGMAWSIESLILFRFLLGIGVGADYPICASYVSEFMPKKIRGRMLIGAFSFQAVGIFLAAAIGLAILYIYPDELSWRFMLLVGAIPATFILVARRDIPESARWHIKRGESGQAVRIICRTLHDLPQTLKDCISQFRLLQKSPFETSEPSHIPYSTLFSKSMRKKTLLVTVPWFLMDVVFYGIGLFTPILLAAMAFEGDGTNFIADDILATEGTAFLDIFLIIGFILNIILIERLGRMKLQIYGFAGMAAGLCLLIIGSMYGSSLIFLLFTGFAVYNLLMNMGPNATTFILPAELFPTHIRATAHGFAAGIAKSGAALGIILVPVLKEMYGITVTLLVMLILVLIALMVTVMCRIETTGRSLEDITE
ncbi:MFS transporter [Methanospirillum stamsii]|uniref:MFS transporter n=1 Tax=Methanospirillum stamsii TaxID=1277351 RepID=A0A2V2N3F1_9EURY|nr:MFS transporter [Methanospirillum stamsii]PWR70717.1 MFS transporter [Methanospirillum stamsii]